MRETGREHEQRNPHITWCKKRKRARESVNCDISCFIKEMKLDEGDAMPSEAEILTPQDWLANQKALPQRSKIA